MLLNFIYISLSNSPVLLYPNSPFKWVIFVVQKGKCPHNWITLAVFCKPKCGLCSLLYVLRVCKPGSTGAGAVAPLFSIPAPNGCALCCTPKNPDFEDLPSVLVVLLKAPLRSKVITKKKSFPVLHLVLELFFKLQQAFKDCSVRQLKAPHVSGFKRRHLSHRRPCLCLIYFNCKL